MAYGGDLYKRSIFFEILSVDASGNPLGVIESFAFSIPPQNIDIVQPQRVTKTPTPGGYFVDNYGLDGAKINISGDTGNGESRLTVVGPSRSQLSVTGKQSYFEFRDRIERYSQKSQSYVMRFYDLTHKGALNIFSDDVDAVTAMSHSEAWEVVLDESSSKRNSSKPFFYPYTISLTGIRPLGTLNQRTITTRVGFLSDIRQFIENVTDKIDDFRENVDAFVSKFQAYADDVMDIVDAIVDAKDSVVKFKNQVLEYEAKIAGQVEDVLSATAEVLNDGLRVIKFPHDAAILARDKVNEISGLVQRLVNQLRVNGEDVLEAYGWEEEIDPASELEEGARDIVVAYNPIIAYSKQNAAYDPVGSIAINGESTLVYGFYDYVIKENTRLDSVATEILGDPDLKDVLSAINDVYANDELVTGSVLKVPILVPNVRFAANAVYTDPSEDIDILGRDIRIGDDGVISVSSVDYVPTSGEETVQQAIFMRLSEKRGRQVRSLDYGVLTQIGEALSKDAPLELLAVSARETLVQDPRIVEVYDVSFIPDADKVYQRFRYDTISLASGVYTGGLG